MSRGSTLIKSGNAGEYLLLIYRFCILLVLFSFCRIIFYLFNSSLFPGINPHSMLRIMKGGLMFDISALLYINSLFFILSLIPVPFKPEKWYQSGLKWLFIFTNGLALLANCIDLVYYRFILKRTTSSVFELIGYIDNKTTLTVQFIIDYWYVPVIWLILIYVLIKLYSAVHLNSRVNVSKINYILRSFAAILIVAILSVIGIRGGYLGSTRPINMNNAGKYVNSPEEMALVQNTPFCIIRTLGKKSFKKLNYFPNKSDLEKIFNPVIIPADTLKMKKDNVVVIILESFSREFVGALNKNVNNGNYQGYTPFLDSLISHSLVFPNAFANGRKSIDAIPSVTASIPSLVLPYVLSERSGNRINSLASLLSSQGYETSFFHGAPNGSMGFDAFTRIAGFNNYYGKNEYGSDEGFDGIWGIWDEPFLQFFADQMNKMKEPFATAVFTVSSHHPFNVPEQYTEKFPDENIPLQKCIRYTDYALKRFFEKARSMPWYKNTLFVITADHCSESDIIDYQTLYNKFAVPLIFHKADGTLTGIDSSVAQQADIMPSVLAYLNYPEPYVAFGNNLFDNNAKRFAISFIEESYQFLIGNYALYFNEDQITGVYDRINDPFLRNNLTGKINLPAEETLFKSVVQQYNNRMLENRLTP